MQWKWRQSVGLWVAGWLTLLGSAPLAAELETIAEGLDRPWAMAFLPDGTLLVTEKSGQLRRVTTTGVISEPLAGVPPVYFASQGGLMDVVLHPDFANNGLVYLTLSHGTAQANATRVVRGRLEDETLENVEVVHTVTPTKDTPVHYGGRLAFLADGTLLLTTGDGFNYREAAQDLGSQLGKTLRMTADGEVPSDNPFVGRSDADPMVYSYGHRNPQGLVVTEDDAILLHEHGPMGGDELNRIEAGGNYGWPAATYGKDYTGAAVSPFSSLPTVTEPLMVWVPSIAPAGMTDIRGDRFGPWRGQLLVGALVDQEVRRVTLGDSWQRSEDAVLFPELNARIREVREGPDGCLYLLTDGAAGRLLRSCTPLS